LHTSAEDNAAPAITGRRAAPILHVTGSARRSTAARRRVNIGSVARSVMTRLTCIIPSAQFSVIKPMAKTEASTAVFCSWSAFAIGWNFR
jgi:hypothetical protein